MLELLGDPIVGRCQNVGVSSWAWSQSFQAGWILRDDMPCRLRLLGWVAESPVDSLWEFFPSLVGSICPLCARIYGLTHCMGPNHEWDFCSILVGGSYPKLLLAAEALKSGWTVEARAFSGWIRIVKSIGIPVCCRVRWGTIEAILNSSIIIPCISICSHES